MATSELKPFILYIYGPSPNPWKVILILEELNLPYESIEVKSDELKVEPFISVNPNGRVPGLVDPNKDLKLWESGAIIDYLIAEYDPEAKLQYTTFAEKYTSRCWEHFQMSGQGPYFGQLAWFRKFHPEHVQSAIDRYAKEVHRVTSVIDTHFENKQSKFLVGDKLTYADLMWLPYFAAARIMFADIVDLNQYTQFSAWLDRMLERPAVAAVMKKWEDVRAAAMAPAQK